MPGCLRGHCAGEEVPMTHHDTHDDTQDDTEDRDRTPADQDGNEGQVSELAPDGDEPTPISPGDSVAAQPDGESGETQEGNQGPNAAPVHDPPQDDNKWGR